MLDPRKIDEMVRSLTDILPLWLKAIQEDIENNIRTALMASFTKFDLVTREEFDTQTQVLHRTCKKLGALEKRVAELELRQ